LIYLSFDFFGFSSFFLKFQLTYFINDFHVFDFYDFTLFILKTNF